jgi:hypothetical protein
VDPVRFLNIAEIHAAMSEAFGTLVRAEVGRFQLDAAYCMFHLSWIYVIQITPLTPIPHPYHIYTTPISHLHHPHH